MKEIKSIIFMMTEENIHGRTILSKLLEFKIPIKCIIVEHKTKYSEKAKNALNNNFFNPKKTLDLIKDYDIPINFVLHHNGNECEKILKKYSPDFIILGGTRLLSKKIIDIAKIGIFNSHPAILPKYKGRDCIGWSILNNEPVGATVHLIDSGIDSGPIIIKEEVEISDCENLIKVRIKVMKKCAELMLKSIIGITFETINPTIQDNQKSIEYNEMNDNEIKLVEKKIQDNFLKKIE